MIGGVVDCMAAAMLPQGVAVRRCADWRWWGREDSTVSALMISGVFVSFGPTEQRLATGMTPEDVEGFLTAFASAAEPVELSFLWRPQLRDPANELMLEAAVNGRADALVTHNIDDFQSATERFGVRTLTPGAILKELAR